MQPRSPGTRVLLVEEEPTIAVTLGDDLAESGYVVTHVADGRRALALLAEEEFAAVITDLRLPGAGGLEVAAAAQRAAGSGTAPAKVLLITASAPPEGAVGIDAVLRKPFANARVLAWLAARVA